jgi:15-cis-phytoene synthase
MDALKNYAYEFHALMLFMPQEKRAEITTLYEFYVELATIRARIKNGLAGEVRLQWWKDSLEKGERTSPLIAAIQVLIAKYNLPLSSFIAMCEARVFDMYEDKFKDWDEFEGYCGETICAIFQLTALILNEGKAVETGDLAAHAGIAYALSGVAPFEDAKARRSLHLSKAKALYHACPRALRPAFRLYNLQIKQRELHKFLRLAMN